MTASTMISAQPITFEDENHNLEDDQLCEALCWINTVYWTFNANPFLGLNARPENHPNSGEA